MSDQARKGHIQEHWRLSGTHHLTLFSLGMDFPRVGASRTPVLYLVLEVPDHEEEIGADNPSDDAADGIRDSESDECLEDVEDVHDEADSGEDDPGLHHADISLHEARSKEQCSDEISSGF